MRRHFEKDQFFALSIVINGLMILSGFTLVFGAATGFYLMLAPFAVNIMTFIKITFGSIVASFIIFAFAEFLELLLKIELNTRKSSSHATPAKSRRR